MGTGNCLIDYQHIVLNICRLLHPLHIHRDCVQSVGIRVHHLIGAFEIDLSAVVFGEFDHAGENSQQPNQGENNHDYTHNGKAPSHLRLTSLYLPRCARYDDALYNVNNYFAIGRSG